MKRTFILKMKICLGGERLELGLQWTSDLHIFADFSLLLNIGGPWVMMTIEARIAIAK